MILPSKHLTCIWCDRGFLDESLADDSSISFGSTPRSKEHIFPECIGGRITTTDLCKCCNNRFGELIDIHLIRDEKVMQAASDAGIKTSKFLKPLGAINGTSSFSDGSKRPGALKDGVVRTHPKLSDPTELSISAFDSQFSNSDIRNLKKRLISKHGEINKQRVNNLVDRVIANPNETVFDPVLNEGFRPIPATTGMKLMIDSDPWKSHWCLAKIVVETAKALLSCEYASYFNPVFDELKKYVATGIQSSALNNGTGCFEYSRLKKTIGRMHRVNISADTTAFTATVILYGTASWRYSISVEPISAPSFSEDIVLDNPLDRNIDCPTPKIKRHT